MDVTTKTYVDSAISGITYPVTSVNGQTGAVNLTLDRVKSEALNGLNSGKGLLMSNNTGTGGTSTIYTTDKLMWNDYGPTLYIYSSDKSRYTSIAPYRISLGDPLSTYQGMLTNNNLTANRTYSLPDATGKLALTSDIPSVPNWALQSTKPTYTASEVGATTTSDVNSLIATAIGEINSFEALIVQTLPTENIDTHTIYFISNSGSGTNVYDEYMYINNN